MNHHNINNNPVRGNFVFGNPGGLQMQVPVSQHLISSQTQQPQARPYFQGHFQPSQPQAQAFGQPQGQTNITISPSTNVSTPGTGKRLQKPPSRPSGGSSGAPASPMKTMELTPAVHRKKRKLPDKLIPEKVAAILPESSLYTQLLELESRVDAALSRKKIDILESLKNPVQTQKILRIYAFNTFTNQTQAGSEKAPSWTLKLIGRILEDGKDPSLVQKSSTCYPKFSSFFKKITIYLDQALYPDNHVILWDNSRSPAVHEGFEIKRKGDKEFTAIIRLEMNYTPEKFKLSPALQEVVGIEIETRPKILTAIWHYVKMKKLQIRDDISSFTCDPPLRKIFGEEKMKFSMVTQKITPHLIPPGPIQLQHRVKLSGDSPVGNTCYDVLVDVPLVVEENMLNFLDNLDKNSEIDAFDKAISSSIKKIHEHRRRRDFFLGFSQSPAELINALIASQARDLKAVAADTNRNVEKERRAEFYSQPWIEDAVIRYLNRKNAVGNETAGNR